MKSHKIKTKKQDNGLYGMPLQCIKNDGMCVTSEEILLKHTAIRMAIAESHIDETFELFWYSINGFFVHLSKSGIRKICYDEYILKDNVITWIVTNDIKN